MFSYWEQQSLLAYDYIVIGAGTVGLHTAIELREHYPKASILVLERSLFPYGASTRNAGFACVGSLTELVSDAENSSAEEVYNLVVRRKKGLERLRHRLSDAAIGYRSAGSHELLEEKDLSVLDKMDLVNEWLSDLLPKKQALFTLANHKIETFGFPKDKVKALVANHAEGELHTGKMMWALKEYALHAGIEIKTGATVTHIEDSGQIWLTDGVRLEQVALSCKKIFVCTNAFTPSLLPHYDLKPGRGQVLLTEPIPNLSLRGIFHFDEGYYYFRELEGRVLFGGGRNQDFVGETTNEIALNAAIQQDLELKLNTLILPGKNIRIDMRWAGIMAFGKSKQPVVEHLGGQLFGAFRMGGMGVALAAQAAAELVEISQQQTT